MERSRMIATLRAALGRSPAVALVGPRQAGKTTLARRLARAYYDLESAEDRLRLDLEWDRVERGTGPIVLDEAQAWPEVFPRLRGAIDRDRKRRGRFLLLGSVSPSLMREVSESLAGRMAIVPLAPFLLEELPRARRGRHWLRGGFPDGGVLSPRSFPAWQNDYLALLAQRDLPTWGLQARPALTQRLFRMLAAAHGQSWNASQIGAALGLSYHTVQTYVEFLEGAYLIRFLPPFHANLRKRLTKRPKLFWRDSGLLHALLGVRDERQLFSQPWVGASWEGYVIEQILSSIEASGKNFQGHYLRTSDGIEIDLLLEMGNERWAVEVKLTASPDAADAASLDRAADLVRADRRLLVTRAVKSVGRGRTHATNLEGALRMLARSV